MPAMPRQPLIALMILGSLIGHPLHAEIYTWVDEHGNTHFSDQRPQNQKSQRVNLGQGNQLESSRDYGPSVLSNRQQQRQQESESAAKRRQEAEQAAASQRQKDAEAWTQQHCRQEGGMKNNAAGGVRNEPLRMVCDRPVPKRFKGVITKVDIDDGDTSP